MTNRRIQDGQSENGRCEQDHGGHFGNDSADESRDRVLLYHLKSAMDTPNTPFEWTAHPLRAHPVKAIVAIGLVLFCGVLVGAIVADPVLSPWAAGGSILFLFITLNRFFLPSKYRMDQHGIAVRYPLRTRVLRWSEIKRFRHDQEGGYVSPRLRGGVFDTGGISLLFAAHAAEIILRIDASIDPAGSVSRCAIGGPNNEIAQTVSGQEDKLPGGSKP